MTPSPKIVCFDLGGVLVHVASTWPEAMRSAGLEPTVPEDTLLHMAPPFDLYQAGQLDTRTYISQLADFLQVSEDEAELSHDHILLEETKGTGALIDQLHAKGTTTACLSNTNELHWPELTGPRFPNIASLQLKFASQDLGVAKPDLAIFRKFEELTQAQPHEILFFEDTMINVQGAQAAGWNVVRIDPKASQEEQICASLEQFKLLP